MSSPTTTTNKADGPPDSEISASEQQAAKDIPETVAVDDTQQKKTEVLIIQPTSGWIPVDFRELIRFRELLFFLVWRDVKVRYKQTVLGVAWAVLVPVLSMIVFTVIFGNFAGLKNSLPPDLVASYPVYIYAGLLPWLFFANAISLGGMSLVSQQNLLTKIYFPRLFVPTATVGSGLVDMALSGLVFVALMAYYGVVPGTAILLIPFLLLLTCFVALGIAYALSALTVSYRDFRFVIPFMVQVWQYMSPVVYPSSIVPEQYRWILFLNPMTGIIDGFRSAVFGLPIPWVALLMSTCITCVLFVFGMFYFRKTERRFADIA